MIETISNFVHVPLLVIDDAHELKTSECKFEHSILAKLLRIASYDIEKASVGIVLFRNVNHYAISTQKSIAKLMREGKVNFQ
jgi:ATP-dependent protease Clp ATPase subunit